MKKATGSPVAGKQAPLINQKSHGFGARPWLFSDLSGSTIGQQAHSDKVNLHHPQQLWCEFETFYMLGRSWSTLSFL